MKIRSLNSLFGGLLVVTALPFLASCGGGAGGSSTTPGGLLSISPSAATVYAGVPITFVINGGRAPYQLSSSEPSLLPLPSSTDSHSITVIANNPGVVDIGLPDGALPVRSTIVTVRSGDGQTFSTPSGSAGIQIAQNFLIGYGVSFTPASCPSATGGTAPTTGNVVCAGADAAVEFSAVTAGLLHGNEAFKISILVGTGTVLIDPSTNLACTNTSTPCSVLVTSDHTGRVLVILRVARNTPTQQGVLRVQEVSTGVYHDVPFVITGNTSTTTLTALPSTLTFTGATTADCGTGTSDVLIFDGTPPYAAVSSNTDLARVSPASSSTQPGRFTITAGNRDLCGNTTVVFTDSAGARTTVNVITAAGSASPPPSAFTVSPGSLTLDCGQTGSVSAVGGSGTYSSSSSSPFITTTVTGSTISATRGGTPPTLPGGNTNYSVTVTDGASTQTITVTAPTNCS